MAFYLMIINVTNIFVMFYFLFTEWIKIPYHKTNNSPFAETCPYCNVRISSGNLRRHIRTQHTAFPTVVCNFCSRTFKNKYSLREHVRISHIA